MFSEAWLRLWNFSSEEKSSYNEFFERPKTVRFFARSKYKMGKVKIEFQENLLCAFGDENKGTTLDVLLRKISNFRDEKTKKDRTDGRAFFHLRSFHHCSFMLVT